MQIIDPSYEILTKIDPEIIMASIERAGRTAYKSEDTDYFYFLCPKCGEHLWFVVEELWEVPTRFKGESPLKTTQHLELHVFCPMCQIGGRLALDSDCVTFHVPWKAKG